jgi:Putative auto-transporter adhesin, head GIN domain
MARDGTVELSQSSEALMKPGLRSISTSMVTFLSILAAAFLAFAAPAQAAGDGWSFKIGNFNAVKGSGVVKTESRAVTGFQAISLRGSMNIVVRQSDHEGLQLSGDDNVLPLIDANVVNKNGVPTLELGTKSGTNVMTDNSITATIDVTTLSAVSISGSGQLSGDGLKAQSLALTISGSGEVKLKQLSADDVTVRISGSGDVQFTGRTTRLGVNITGNGVFDSTSLEADNVTMAIAGNGDAKVNARKTLDASISGNGDVEYVGDAVVKSHISGHGEVKKQH